MKAITFILLVADFSIVTMSFENTNFPLKFALKVYYLLSLSGYSCLMEPDEQQFSI